MVPEEGKVRTITYPVTTVSLAASARSRLALYDLASEVVGRSMGLELDRRQAWVERAEWAPQVGPVESWSNINDNQGDVRRCLP